MNRRDFLNTSGKLGLGSALLNGIPAFLSNSSNYSNCAIVADRILVVLHLQGANDGINTIIPIAQYDTYASLRPKIKINSSGTGAYINLDNTLPDDRKSGLHPSLVGFKDLYDRGLLNIINGVGFPQPTYSHFQSEIYMYTGADGTTSGDIPFGVLGRYLSKVYPGSVNNPNALMPDPLAVHLGSSNTCPIYNNSPEVGIEYNINSFENTLFQQGSYARILPQGSEYNSTLNYVENVQYSMDKYYQRLFSVFSSGSNSSTVYPNSYLAKQLKTVARLINGGSKTKVFHVTLGGFDTHAYQVEGGASHTGVHATLLADLSSSVLAFQKDLEILGLQDRVMSTTFSEFGRQLKENDSLGTDHGDISPFFIIGSNVNPGVIGSHPNLSLVTPTNRYPESERKKDYRTIYTSLLQNWLGANDKVIEDVGLTQFNNVAIKPEIIKSSANASPNCLSSSVLDCANSPADVTIAVKIFTEGNWSYYAPAGYNGNKFLFGIEHNPIGAGFNTNTFTAQVTLTKLICNPSGNKTYTKNYPNKKSGIFVSGYYWNIKILSGSVNGNVNIRFFQDESYITELNSLSNSFKVSTGAAYLSPLIWFRTIEKELALNSDLRSDGKGFNNPIKPLSLSTTGALNGYSYLEFKEVSQINNTGGGAMVIVTDTNQLNFVVPAGILGAIRLNSTTSKFEGFDGETWVQF